MRKLYLSTLLLLLVCWCGTALAQQVNVSGTVTGADSGIPLPGVSVIVKGTTTGVTTSADGTFQISVPNQESVLLFRFLGYEVQETRVGNQRVFNVRLNPDSKQLGEVVVTALGIAREERSLGYATQEVKGEDLTLTKEQNVLGSLSGKVAGVQMTGSSGSSMGGTQKIQIRGVNSVTGGGQPLIVVDGTPISNANFAGRSGADYGNLAQDINPEDVESINVLKGPAASALYGIRGQYGVVMITTKKGKKGPKKVDVQLNSAFSVEKVGNFMPMQNIYGGGGSQTWRTLANGEKYVDGTDESWGPKMDGTPVRHMHSFYPQDPMYGQLEPFVPQPDNIKDFFETGHNLNNGVSISGGNENSSFRLSYNNTRIEGVEPNTWLKRNNLGLSASLDLSDKITASANINYANNDAQRPSQGYYEGSRNFMQWFQRNLDMKRLKNYKYDDGTFYHWNIGRPNAQGVITNWRPSDWNNPYFEAYENLNNDNRDRFFGDVGLTYQVLPDLKVSGFVRSDMYTQNIESRIAAGGRSVNAAYSTGKYQNKEMNYEFLAQYTKEWNDFSFNVNVGANLFDRNYTYLSQATRGGLTSPGFYNIEGSSERPAVASYLLRKQLNSIYGMATVGYKDTYFVDFSLRRDHSSTLPDPYYYPSVSASFVFSELLNWQPLSFGKLRASYAMAGNDVSVYATSMNYEIGGLYGTVNTSFVPDVLNNPLIKPSFATSYEVGADLKFFNGRLGADVTYYEQRNEDDVITLNVSGASGYSSSYINAGLMVNKGIEIALTGTPIQTQNFSWDIAFNAARNRGTVKELYPGLDSRLLESNTYSGVSMYLYSNVGEQFGSIVGQAYQRDPETGKILLGSNNMPLYTTATHNFGSVLPDATGGLQNSFRLGKFDLSAMIDYQLGGQFISWSRMLAVKAGLAPETAAINENGKNVRDPLAEGGGVKVSGIYGPGVKINDEDVSGREFTGFVDARTYFRNTLGTRIYEEWIYDASYVRLREIRLGYSLDKASLGSLPFQKVGIAFIARNPLMIWQKAPEGLNPAELATGSSSFGWLETGGLNTVRSYGVNLNISF
ncbi:SusC/RagA family TonB-linked outer membrane protein [Pontibacter chinhatensis]|uniref:TonB-linked outer membrane protein, SusC/RagA family n=1 Tax=Pontibacter chinhatensis TaxID=1436961 RepID=A0A1I2NIH9_9BACT|nr:SusC/RagA family TonB-linked outer membrane protein [Pontibacter chinhatensis]SFG02619.1 TonB-linked outer membrane protein, SusC/RagA family [Pontibacter chinhatensis]